jgi:hypothetical protein
MDSTSLTSTEGLDGSAGASDRTDTAGRTRPGPAAAPAPVPRPPDTILVQAIITNDAGAGPNAPSLSRSQIQTVLDAANTIYTKAGITFRLDGVQRMDDTALNQDYPPPTGDGRVAGAARQRVAAQFPGRLVVFFRDGGGGASGAQGDFLHTAKTDDPAQGGRLFAHEVGHYLHLVHTFGNYVGVEAAEQHLTTAQKIEVLRKRQRTMILQQAGPLGLPRDRAVEVFDGDAPDVADTPPDDGGELITLLNNGAPAGPIGSVDIDVTFPGEATPRRYVLQPDRGNVMSYFHKELSIPQRLSAGQVGVVRTALEQGNRRHLLKGPQWVDPEIREPGSPTVVSWGPGHLDVVVRGDDRHVKHRTWDASTGEWWPSGNWQDLGGFGVERPAAVSRGPGEVDLFTRDLPEWTVQHKSWSAGTGVWWPGQDGWAGLGGVGVGRPVVVSRRAGQLDLFARWPDGSVRNKAWTSGNNTWWPGQLEWQHLGGSGTGAPEVVAWGPDHLDLFIRGTDGNILHKAWDVSTGQWWPGLQDWQDLGGQMVGAPAAVSWGPGRVDLFARGRDGRIHNKVWESARGDWWPSRTGWQDLGGDGNGPPVAVSWGPGHLDVFAVEAGGAVLHKAWNADPGTWWPAQTDWQNLGGSVVGVPSAVSWEPGRVDLFVRGADRHVHNKVWESARGDWWPNRTGWQDLGAP